MYEVVIEVDSRKDAEHLALILYRAGYAPYMVEGKRKHIAIQIASDDVTKLELLPVKESK